jgi:DNA invertase Pin-like site-specific DNA recombinase
MEHPAVRQRLRGVQARRLDIVVVYKVNRLTRLPRGMRTCVAITQAHQGVSCVTGKVGTLPLFVS